MSSILLTEKKYLNKTNAALLIPWSSILIIFLVLYHISIRLDQCSYYSDAKCFKPCETLHQNLLISCWLLEASYDPNSKLIKAKLRNYSMQIGKMISHRLRSSITFLIFEGEQQIKRPVLVSLDFIRHLRNAHKSDSFLRPVHRNSSLNYLDLDWSLMRNLAKDSELNFIENAWSEINRPEIIILEKCIC